MKVFSIIELEKNNFFDKNSNLRISASLITKFDNELQKLIDNLIFTLKEDKLAIGLAAIQVNIPIQLAVINLNKNKDEPTLVIINPKIISVSGKKEKKKESCMSIPHYRGEVIRRDKVHFSYKDRFGNDQEMKASGYLARVLLHEIDHLQGILYIDRMDDGSKIEETDIFIRK